jgi:arylsulfatase A-like enzyme
MITCHDLGRHLGCYGQATVNSPALDQLAESGLRFENSFCTAPQCSPSRASLHTGRYPHATGMLGLQNLGWDIDPGEQHLARLLHQAGYQTALIGLQHITSQPETLGYDRIENIYGAAEAGKAVSAYLNDVKRKGA